MEIFCISYGCIVLEVGLGSLASLLDPCEIFNIWDLPPQTRHSAKQYHLSTLTLLFIYSILEGIICNISFNQFCLSFTVLSLQFLCCL